jgi:hypothetical protein
MNLGVLPSAIVMLQVEMAAQVRHVKLVLAGPTPFFLVAALGVAHRTRHGG